MKTSMKCGVFAALAIALPIESPALADIADVPLDKTLTVNGVEGACTGVGAGAETDTRWTAYPLRIEFAGKAGQFVVGAKVTVARDGKDLASFHCDGAWLLLKLPAAEYRITGVLDGQTDTTKAFVPATGQGRVILRFPNSGGTVSPQYEPKS